MVKSRPCVSKCPPLQPDGSPHVSTFSVKPRLLFPAGLSSCGQVLRGVMGLAVSGASQSPNFRPCFGVGFFHRQLDLMEVITASF